MSQQDNEWIPVSDETLARVAAMHELPPPQRERFIDLRGTLGQMSFQRFRREVRRAKAADPRLSSAPAVLDNHHLEALKREARRVYRIPPDKSFSVIGGSLFGHEIRREP